MKIKLLIFAVLITSYFYSFLDPESVIALGQEDGWIESLGAGFFLLASCMLFVCFVLAGKTNRENDIPVPQSPSKYYYLLLAIILFVCFGEEISWGQRIWDWETPEALKKINAQQETNVHNLWMFYADNVDGSKKSGFEKLFVLTRLFTIFTFFIFIAIPLMDRYSAALRQFIKKIQMPVIPLWMGGLVLANYVVFHTFNHSFLGSPSKFMRSINELKETNYAFIYAVLAFNQLVAYRLPAHKKFWSRRDKKLTSVLR